MPIEESSQQVQDDVAFSKAGEEKTTNQKQVHIGYNLMHKTDRFGSMFECWSEKYSTEKHGST